MKMRRWKPVVFYVSLALVLLVSFFGKKLIGDNHYEITLAAVLLFFSILNWILETVSIAVTSLTLVALVPLSGIMSFSDAIAGSFGNSIFAFFLGVLLLSFAFKHTNLGRLISDIIFKIFGRQPKRVVLGIMLTGALLAMWVTEVAAAAIVFPIALSIWDKAKERDDYAAIGKAVMLGVAWGCAFGGVATPIATGANLIAVNYLETYCGIKITFGHWMMIGIPICFSLILAGWWILTLPLKSTVELGTDSEAIEFGRKERKLSVIFAVAILGWIFGDKIGLGSHQVAIISAIALFLPGIEVIDWKTGITNISWNSIFLISAGVLIGDVLYSSGLAEKMANIFFVPSLLENGILIRDIYIVISVSILKILFSSNTVSGVVLVPIMLSVAAANSLSPWGLVAPCIFSSALFLIVVSSSPVNVIPYSSKAFSPKDMALYGIVMTIMTALIIGGWLTVFGVN